MANPTEVTKSPIEEFGEHAIQLTRLYARLLDETQRLRTHELEHLKQIHDLQQENKRLHAQLATVRR